MYLLFDILQYVSTKSGNIYLVTEIYTHIQIQLNTKLRYA